MVLDEANQVLLPNAMGVAEWDINHVGKVVDEVPSYEASAH